jgi:RNA polymerase sigma-70 factor (ECF subfamily)
MKTLPELNCQAACLPMQSADKSVAERTEEQSSQLEARLRGVLQQMIDRHSRFVYRVAFALVRNAADAEDVVQETFLQLLRGSPARVLDGAIQDERGYLARVAWRLSVRRKQRPPPEARSEEILLQQLAPGRSPEQAALDGNLETWLHRRIDELPPKLRQPLALAALGELASPQIAVILGIPEGTVRRRIHTARQLLRRHLEVRSLEEPSPAERKGGAA